MFFQTKLRPTKTKNFDYLVYGPSLLREKIPRIITEFFKLSQDVGDYDAASVIT